MADIPVCWRCGHSLEELSMPPGRLDECPECRSQLHVCRMCAFFNPEVIRACREDDADEVMEKERANFCDYFQANSMKVSLPLIGMPANNWNSYSEKSRIVMPKTSPQASLQEAVPRKIFLKKLSGTSYRQSKPLPRYRHCRVTRVYCPLFATDALVRAPRGMQFPARLQPVGTCAL